MNDEEETRPAAAPERPAPSAGGGRRLVVNIVLGVAVLVAAYAADSYFARPAAEPQEPSASAARTPAKVIQLDVLNGCGASGIAARFTSFLRTSGFDVVEMKNYKVRTIEKTMVVDRVGDLAAARRVAAALGVQEANVVQQLNPDYFVDVSVIIGADYKSLEPLKH